MQQRSQPAAKGDVRATSNAAPPSGQPRLGRSWHAGCRAGRGFMAGCALLLAAGCGADPEPPLALQLSSNHGKFEGFFSMEPGVPSTGENLVHVRLSRHETPVKNATLALDLWMVAHGHGGGAEAEVNELGRGKYDIEHVVFPMPGRWSLGLDVSLASLEDRFDFVLDVH